MMLRLSAAGLLMGMAALAGTASSTTPTFDKDVLPILQKHCQTCHRPGEMAPMSLITYNDARPWAKAIKQAVATKKMPPWFADYGHFANDRTLREADVKTLVSWADNGAPEGDAKDAPAAVDVHGRLESQARHDRRDARRRSTWRPPGPSTIRTFW